MLDPTSFARQAETNRQSKYRSPRLGLLASGSVAALLLVGGTPAFACYTGPFTGGYINSGPTACIVVNNTSFTGSLANSGTISPGNPTGIAVTNGSTIAGSIGDSGVISTTGYGILVDQSSKISSGGTAIDITGPSFAGGISNAGTVSGALRGILVWIPMATFSGGIHNAGTISAGTLAVGIQINAHTFLGGITNSGTITGGFGGINLQPSMTQFSGGISNTGTITSAATAVAVVGVSTFSGGITNSGTIYGREGIGVAANNAVSIFDSGVIVGTGGTAVIFNAAGNTFTLGPGYSITGLVKGQGSDTFQLGGSGSGSFNLSSIGGAQQYQGFTTFNVVGGIWNTTGVFSQTQTWNVNGGTLAGTGTFNSVNVNSGGTLSPGTIGAPGTSMTINGNLTFASGAFYQVYVNPGTSSFANVSGTASLAGTVNANFAAGSYISKVYTILNAGSVTGTFGGVTTTNLPSNFTASLSYGTANAYLDLALNYTPPDPPNTGPAAPSYVPLSGNQNNVANALISYFNANGGIPTAFGTLNSSGLTHVDGEAAAGAGKGANQLMTDFLELMLDPTAGGGSSADSGATGFAPEQDASLPADVALAYAKALKAPPPQAAQNFDQRWTAWGSAFGGASFTNGNAALGANNVAASDYGFAAGMETHLTPDTVYGFGLAGGGTNWNLAQGLGNGRSDSFQAGVYAKTHFGPAYVSAALAFANHWFTTDRTALGDQLQANFTGQSYAARLEGGYRVAVPISGAQNSGAIVGVTPYAALQAQDFHTPSYSETDLTGGGFGLSYASMNATDTRSELGARFDNLQIMYGMPLVLRGRLAWAHDWVTNPSLGAVFETLPGASFTVNGATPPKNSALTTAAAELHLTANWIAIAKFDGDFGSGTQTYGGTGTLKYSW